MRLGNITDIARGASPRPINEYLTNDESGIPWIKIGDTELGGKYIYSTKERIISSAENLSRRIDVNDFLLTNSMSFGRPYISKISGCIHDGWLVIKFNNDIFNIDYLYYLLSSPFMFSQFSNNAAGSAFKNLKSDTVRNSLVALPPLEEQKRIIAKIEELLPFIEQYAKKEQELTALHQTFPERLKKSILQAAIQGKLTEQNQNDEPAVELIKRIQVEKERLILEKKIKKTKQHSEIIVRDNSHYEIVDGVERCIDDEIPFEIPESWCWVRLHQLGILSSGNTPKSEYLAHIGNIPYFKVSDMNTDGNEKYLIYTNHFLNKNYSGKLFSEDSIVFPKNGGAVFTNKKRILKFKSLVDLNTGVFTPSKINYFNYIFIMFNTLDFKKYYKGTALPTVDLNLIGNLLFPIPPLYEQKRIVAKIEQLFLSLENLG